jgi:DNA-binding MarR family transcriptional regulator
LKALLHLCAEQARAGADTAFRCSIPKIIEATGLAERAITMALKVLDKHRLIERRKHPGPSGNRYRVRLGPLNKKQLTVTQPAGEEIAFVDAGGGVAAVERVLEIPVLVVDEDVREVR